MSISKTSPDGRMMVPEENYTFVAPSKGRFVLVGLLTASIGVLAVGLYLCATVGSRSAMIATAAAAVVTVALWAMLQARIPMRIEVHRAVITIIRNGHRERYDLEDPGVELRVRDGEIAFAHYMKPWSIVRARDVEWQTFVDIVMHYQNNADVNAELRDQRFAR